MRRFAKIAVLLALCAFVAFLVYSISAKTENINATRSKRQTLPLAEFVTLEKHSFSTKSLQQDSIILVYFNPDCGHCQDFGLAIKKNQQRFAKHQFVWVSPALSESITAYRDTIIGTNLTNHIFVRDTANTFYSAFGYQTFPSVLVYHQKHLFTAYQGDVKTELLLPRN